MKYYKIIITESNTKRQLERIEYRSFKNDTNVEEILDKYKQNVEKKTMRMKRRR